MMVMVLEKTPRSLRGELTLWLLEVRTGVFIGHVSAMVRDRLWEKCVNARGAGSVFQAWTTNNEQHFSMRIAGDPSRSVVDWEGVLLICEHDVELTPAQKRRTRKKT